MGSAFCLPCRVSLPPQLQPPRTDTVAPLALVETAFLTSAASLIWLVNFYFPLGPVLRIFFPIPIALLALRWGVRSAWMGAVVSGLLLSVLMGPPRSVLYVMPYGLMGVLLGWLWRRRSGWGASIALGTMLGMAGLVFRLGFLSLLLGDDLWLLLTNQVTGLLEWGFVKLGLLLRPSSWVVQAGFVGILAFNSLIYQFSVHLLAWALFDRLESPISEPPRWVRVILAGDE